MPRGGTSAAARHAPKQHAIITKSAARHQQHASSCSSTTAAAQQQNATSNPSAARNLQQRAPSASARQQHRHATRPVPQVPHCRTPHDMSRAEPCWAPPPPPPPTHDEPTQPIKAYQMSVSDQGTRSRHILSPHDTRQEPCGSGAARHERCCRHTAQQHAAANAAGEKTRSRPPYCRHAAAAELPTPARLPGPWPLARQQPQTADPCALPSLTVDSRPFHSSAAEE